MIDVKDTATEAKVLTAQEREALFCEAANITDLDYELRREQIAKEAGVRFTWLDGERQRRRSQQKAANDAGTAIQFIDPEPWPEVVDGVQVLKDIANVFNRYIVLPEGGADMLALWTMHTYAHDAAYISPILGITSPIRGCGKSNVLWLLDALVLRPFLLSNVTASVLFRQSDRHKPTWLIDEADSFLSNSEPLRNAVNAGFCRKGAVYACTNKEDHSGEVFSVWAPKAIAAIKELQGTIMDRSIVLTMNKKLATEKVERLRLDRLSKYQYIPRQCLRWVQDNFNTLKAADPEIAENIDDRVADKWRALLAIADTAGREWSERARQSLALLSSMVPKEDTSVMLLADMQQIFKKWKGGKIYSSELLNELYRLEGRPWISYGDKEKPINPTQIAELLRPHRIFPGDVKINGINKNGYKLEDCADAFKRYDPPQNATTGDPVEDKVVQVPSTSTRVEADNSNKNRSVDPVGPGRPLNTHTDTEEYRQSIRTFLYSLDTWVSTNELAGLLKIEEADLQAHLQLILADTTSIPRVSTINGGLQVKAWLPASKVHLN